MFTVNTDASLLTTASQHKLASQFWQKAIFKDIKYVPKSLSFIPRWLSSSVQTFDTKDRYSSCDSSSTPMSAIVHELFLFTQRRRRQTYWIWATSPSALYGNTQQSSRSGSYLPHDGTQNPHNKFELKRLHHRCLHMWGFHFMSFARGLPVLSPYAFLLILPFVLVL